MTNAEKLQWLLDNKEKIKINKIYPGGHSGSPTLFIEFKDWDEAAKSPFETSDDCYIFE